MVDRIRTPLLVAQGANDVRGVQAESDDIVAALRDRDVPVEHLRHPERSARRPRASAVLPVAGLARRR